MHSLSNTSHNQSGQSLLETVVGIFILVMGITAAIGLASFSYSSSTAINKQVIGSGLAREGLEAVKSMRDSNWLRSAKINNCRDWSSATPTYTATCYQDWDDTTVVGGYNIFGSNAGVSYRLDYNPAATNYNVNFWTLTAALPLSNFNLYLDNRVIGNTVPNEALHIYSHDPTLGRPSDFWRRIVIIREDTTQPFTDSTTGPRLLIRSEVWWADKNCPRPAAGNYTFDQADPSCRISLQTYLTNWKAY